MRQGCKRWWWRRRLTGHLSVLPRALSVQVRMWVLETLLGKLVLRLGALVLVLPWEMLAQVLMLLWVRTFVPFWVLALLMLLVVKVQVQLQAQVLV